MNDQKERLFILAGLASIFLLNDFLFMTAKSYGAWLLIDYGSRLLAVGTVCILVQKRISRASDFGFSKLPFHSGLLWTMLLTASGIVIDQVGWRFLEHVLPDTQLASMPKINNPYLNIFDLTFGVALVALSEELVFRGYCFSALRGSRPTWIIVALSAILFGMIHWSQGLHAIASTALWGILPMLSMARTGSIVPAVIAHYITDLVSLGGFVPENWFGFLQ